MDLDCSTLSKPSQDSLYSREEELFEMFVDFLEGIGGVENLVISDEMIMMDLEYAAERWPGFEADLVARLPSRTQRMILLKRAKRAMLRRYFQEYIDEIADLRKDIDELDDEARALLFDVETIEWSLANYLPEFIGRPPGFRRDHAWLLREDRVFFGKPLSPHDIRHWTKQLLAAAGLSDQAVVYFVSLGDPSKVKIGRTDNLPRRLSSFRNGSPSEPVVHLTLRGGHDLEQSLHRRFKADRIVREWFRMSAAIAEFIRNSKGEDQR